MNPDRLMWANDHPIRRHLAELGEDPERNLVGVSAARRDGSSGITALRSTASPDDAVPQPIAGLAEEDGAKSPILQATTSGRTRELEGAPRGARRPFRSCPSSPTSTGCSDRLAWSSAIAQGVLSA